MKTEDKLINKRLIKNNVFKGFVFFIASLCAIPLVLILFYIVKQGVSALSWNFLISLPKPVGEEGGGIINALTGTLMLIAISFVIAVPIGITCGVYISENRSSKIAHIARLCVEILQGIPSIVIGIIAYLWIVKPLNHFSALSGGIALAMMMLPVIVRTTEETLNLIPTTLKEASLALGVPYYKTIKKIIIPCGLSGIATGVTLSVARIAGETAPLLFTAFGNPYLNGNVLKPVSSLPLIIFNYATSPYDDWHKQAWGASFVLLTLILSINIIAKLIVRKWKVQF